MNRTELIEKIIGRLDMNPTAKEHVKDILEEELPDFQRIDEERFKRIYASKVCDIGLHIKEYNSTLSPALVPLPKEMPKDLTRFAMGHDVDEVWDKIISEYGTPANNLQPLPGVMPALWHDAFTDLLHKRMQPSEFYSLIIKTYGTPAPKQPLPTVEELGNEMVAEWNEHYDFGTLAQKLHDKYSLHPREEKRFPFNLKDGESFMYKGERKEFNIRLTSFVPNCDCAFNIEDCKPYISAQDIIAKHNLSEEDVKIIREGKV